MKNGDQRTSFRTQRSERPTGGWDSIFWMARSVFLPPPSPALPVTPCNPSCAHALPVASCGRDVAAAVYPLQDGFFTGALCVWLDRERVQSLSSGEQTRGRRSEPAPPKEGGCERRAEPRWAAAAAPCRALLRAQRLQRHLQWPVTSPRWPGTLRKGTSYTAFTKYPLCVRVRANTAESRAWWGRVVCQAAGHVARCGSRQALHHHAPSFTYQPSGIWNLCVHMDIPTCFLSEEEPDALRSSPGHLEFF